MTIAPLPLGVLATSGAGFDTAGQAVPVLLEEGLAALRG
jgi:hypothetical protein